MHIPECWQAQFKLSPRLQPRPSFKRDRQRRGVMREKERERQREKNLHHWKENDQQTPPSPHPQPPVHNPKSSEVNVPSWVSSRLWTHIWCSFCTSRTLACTSCHVMLASSPCQWSTVSMPVSHYHRNWGGVDGGGGGGIGSQTQETEITDFFISYCLNQTSNLHFSILSPVSESLHHLLV